MARNPKKHASYKRVCGIIGQPVSEFADRIRQIVGDNAEATARLVTYNPSTDLSYTVSVEAACGGGGPGRADDEFVLTLVENRAKAKADGEGAAAGDAGAPPARTDAAAPDRKMIFKGRVQLPPPRPVAGKAGPSAGGKVPQDDNRGGKPARATASAATATARAVARAAPGLSSIAGVCMLCAVASAGGIAFYASYMSQVADQGNIEIIRAEVVDVHKGVGGRFIDLELFATHTSCVYVVIPPDAARFVLYDEGDGCRDHGSMQANMYAFAESYPTSTGVHVLVNGYPTLSVDDNEWVSFEVYSDSASIIHPVKVGGVR